MAYDKPRNPDELGALWLKSGAKGDYMTGYVEIDGVRTDVVLFPCEAKSDKSPAWRVMKSKLRDGQQTPAPASRTQVPDRADKPTLDRLVEEWERFAAAKGWTKEQSRNNFEASLKRRRFFSFNDLTQVAAEEMIDTLVNNLMAISPKKNNEEIDISQIPF